jgi:hypothetical protein
MKKRQGRDHAESPEKKRPGGQCRPAKLLIKKLLSVYDLSVVARPVSW